MNDIVVDEPEKIEQQRAFHAYDDSAYVGVVFATDTQFAATGFSEGDAPPPPAPIVPDLTPKQFEYLLAVTGLDDIWAALEGATKGKDAVQYATLKAERRSDKFRLNATLKMVAMFRPMAAQIAPDIDLSDETISAAWGEAASYGGQGNG